MRSSRRWKARWPKGFRVSADIYPYVYWQSGLSVLFPDKDYTDREVARFTFERTTTPDKLIVTDFRPDPSVEGSSIAQIAARRGQDPETVLLELTQASDAYLRETGRSGDSIVATSMHEDDVRCLHALAAYQHLFATVANDGGHPRGFGAFPRVLGRYVGDGFPLERAVAKMTSLSAANAGIGRLAAASSPRAPTPISYCSVPRSSRIARLSRTPPRSRSASRPSGSTAPSYSTRVPRRARTPGGSCV